MSGSDYESELELAKKCLDRELQEGLLHGFFDLTVTCEMGNGRKRQLTIKAGKSHRFTIPEDDLQ